MEKTRHGKLESISGGYAIEPHSWNGIKGRAYFEGENFASSNFGGRAEGLKVLRYPNGKASFWAVGKPALSSTKAIENVHVDGHKVELIGHGWARIAGHAYYHGNRVRGVAGKITPHGAHYATDAIRGYYKGEKIDLAGQASSFKLLGGDYAGTQMFAFYNGVKVSQCVNPEKVMGDYLICMGGRVFYDGKAVSAAKCVNPKEYLGHGFLECFTTYLYNGEKLRGPSPQHNRLTVNDDGSAVDKRGKEYGESVEKEEHGDEMKKSKIDFASQEKSDKALFGSSTQSLQHLFQ